MASNCLVFIRGTVASVSPMKNFLCILSFQMLAMFRRELFYNFPAIYLCHFMGLSVTVTTLFATLPMIVNVLTQRDLWGFYLTGTRNGAH